MIEHIEQAAAQDVEPQSSEDAGQMPAFQGNEPDAVDYALENAALAAENRQLKSAAREQKLGKLLGELRFLGKLTPGLEQAGAAEILSAAWELESSGSAGFQPAHAGEGARAPRQRAGATVTLPDGTELPLGEAIANLLYAIPPSWGGEGSAAFPGGGFREPAESRRSLAHGRRAAAPTGRYAHQPFQDYSLPPRLSPTERDIARSLGLTAEEYIGITAEG